MDMNQEPQLEFLSSDADSWTTKASMPTARGVGGMTVESNGKIYIFDCEVSYEYDPLADTWIMRKVMPNCPNGHAVVAASNGKIYSIGGSEVQEYDPVTDIWVSKSPMLTSRSDFGAAAASNGKVYVIGGRNVSGLLSTVEEYDPFSDTWMSKTPMSTKRSNLGVVASNNGKVYAIGGVVLTDIVEEYDPLTDDWITKAPMLARTDYLSVASGSSGKIFVMKWGQFDEYDPETDQWIQRSSMPTPRLGSGVVTATNGKVYVIGGDVVINDWSVPTPVVEEYTPCDWGLVQVTNSPSWLDETHYQVSYDFTSIVPRGEYVVTVKEAMGFDEILTMPFKGSNFLVDYAGEISDTTPPNKPSVNAWGNGELTQLSAKAFAYDPDSEITGYRYAIGSTPGGVEVVNWNYVATAEFTRDNLLLQQNQAYYVSFQARNVGGLWSPVGVSNPVVNGLPDTPIQALFLPLINR